MNKQNEFVDWVMIFVIGACISLLAKTIKRDNEIRYLNFLFECQPLSLSAFPGWLRMQIVNAIAIS